MSSSTDRSQHLTSDHWLIFNRLDVDEHAPSAAAFFTAKQEAAAAEANKAQTEYLTMAAAEEGATQTPSGLVYKETQSGA